jgi:hypothetical protein
MKLTKTIELDIQKKGKILSIGDLMTLQLVLGTTAVSGNQHMYPGLKKLGTRWELPVTTVETQIQRVRARIAKDQNRLDIMTQVVK